MAAVVHIMFICAGVGDDADGLSVGALLFTIFLLTYCFAAALTIMIFY